MIARQSREKKTVKSQKACYDNNLLALLDEDYNDFDDDKIGLEGVNDNSNVSVASIGTQDVMDEPYIPIVQPKHVTPKQNTNNNQPDREPEAVSLRLLNLFNSD